MSEPSIRLGAIDSAKGVGIILVVFGHAWRGAWGANLLPNGDMFNLVDSAIYAFHMPLFFFLSGLLFLETLQKHNTSKLLKGRLTRLLWPMVLWSWIFFALKLTAGQAANSPVALSDFPIVPLPPYEHLWFLWALFLCQTLLILLYSACCPKLPEATWRLVAVIAAVLLAVLNPFVPVPSDIWGPMVQHFPYFIAGIAVGRMSRRGLPLWAGALCAVGFPALIWLVQGEKAAVLHSLAIILLAWGAWLCVDRSTGAQPVGLPLRVLQALGQASMVIYLMHTVFSAALRIVMVKLGIDDISLILVAIVIIGVVAPFVVGWGAGKLRLTKILGF